MVGRSWSESTSSIQRYAKKFRTASAEASFALFRLRLKLIRALCFMVNSVTVHYVCEGLAEEREDALLFLRS